MRLARSSRWPWVWLLAILSLPAVYLAVTQNVAACAYDAANTHVYRNVVHSRLVSDGVLFPRWTQFLHLGLGSPLFAFHPPLAYALLDLFARSGIPHLIGWRLLIAGGLFAAFAGTYLLVFEMTGRRGPVALVATVYLYPVSCITATAVRMGR
jgi:hypothetical protein